MEMEPFTPSPTPPVPMRNPNHRYPHTPALPPLPDRGSKTELIPPPLFCKRKRSPLPTLHVLVHDFPELPPPSPSKSDSASSPTSSFRSSSSSVSTFATAPTSLPSSPSARPRSLTYSFPPPDVANWGFSSWDVPLAPRHPLRRKPSPRKESLRSLREKESDACLQRLYESQTLAYLEGRIFPREKWRDGLGCLEEE